MTQLNQIIAVEKGVKGKAHAGVTEAYKTLQKPALMSGIARTYTPRDDEGEQLPPESTLVQVKATDLIAQMAGHLTRLIDVTATKDWANCTATGNVVVNGVTILNDVPVTHLLFLEKQLTDVRTFIAHLPTLDPSESWEFNETTGDYVTRPAQTVRSKKVPRNHVKAEATDKHPAQVEMYYEDVAVGTWTTVKFSGALPATRVRELLFRVDALLDAVKYAREQANQTEAPHRAVANQIFGYLFG